MSSIIFLMKRCQSFSLICVIGKSRKNKNTKLTFLSEWASGLGYFCDEILQNFDVKSMKFFSLPHAIFQLLFEPKFISLISFRFRVIHCSSIDSGKNARIYLLVAVISTNALASCPYFLFSFVDKNLLGWDINFNTNWRRPKIVSYLMLVLRERE